MNQDAFGQGPASGDFAPRRVLVVEDDQGLNALLCKTLRRKGLEAEGALSGRQAVEAVRAEPDVVLLVDHLLPDMLGTDLMRELLGLGRLPPFVAMTGHGDENVAVEMMKLGARDYLVKGGEFLEHLPEVIKRVFREVETERRLAAAEVDLHRSEARFRRLVELSPGVVYVRCPDFRGRYYSPRVFEVLGYTPDQLVERAELWRDCVHPEDRPRVLAAFETAAGGKAFDQEYRVRSAGGQWRWVHDQSMGVIQENGDLLVEGLAMDITERKRAEEALRESVDKFQGLFVHSPIGMLLLDSGGRILDINPAAETIVGVYREKYNGARLVDILADKGLVRFVAEGLEKGESRFQACNTSVLDGRELCLKAMLLLIRPGLCLLFVEDVTEQERLKELMIQNEKMMSVGGLAAGMAHEINNPLSGILQGLQVVIGRTMTDLPGNKAAAQEVGCDLEQIRAYMKRREVVSMIEAVNDAAKRAASIVQHMLAFSRKSESTHSAADIHVLLDNAVELCSTDYDLKKRYDFKRIVIERDYAPNLPLTPCSVTRIEQVFMNILRNAAQAMAGLKEPKIAMRTRLDGDMVRVSIEDNGPGMDENTRRRIFEPFFTTKCQGEGTGLGLSVSYFIVTNNHDGTIEVESQPGKGTTIIVRLPALVAQDKA